MPHLAAPSSLAASGSTVAGFQFPRPPPHPRRTASLRARAASAAGGGVRAVEPTFYELLGIPAEGSSFEDVRAAYRRMARRYHPDVSPPGAAGEHTRRFIQVQEAYETLSDPGRRSSYDRALARGLCRLAFNPASRNVSSLYRQVSNNRRTSLYKALLSEHRHLATKHAALQADHQAAQAAAQEQVNELLDRIGVLTERQDTIFNLKGQIEDLKEQQQAEIAQVSRDAANEIADLKLKHGEEVKGLNDKYEEAQAEASDISQALEALREKIKGWENTASAIDAKLNASSAVLKEQDARLARGERVQTGPLQMEDYLTSFESRIEPLLSQLNALQDAVIHAHSVLHPGEDPADDPRDVAESVIATAAAQVELYCTSAARAGADDALRTVLSWYEGINLDKLQGLRAGSKWLTNAELVKKRGAAAIEIASYIDTDTLFLDAEEELAKQRMAEEAGQNDEDSVDEEIDMDAAAARNANPEAGAGDAGTATADAGAASTDAGATGTEASTTPAAADIASSSATGTGSAAI